MTTKTEEKRLNLQYKFTDEETLVLSKRLAELNNKLQDLEESKKSAMSDFKSRIDISKEEMAMISRKIYSGFEMRNIDCVILYHTPVWGKKLITRKDTGEQWEEKMTYDENNLFNQLPEENTGDNPIGTKETTIFPYVLVDEKGNDVESYADDNLVKEEPTETDSPGYPSKEEVTDLPGQPDPAGEASIHNDAMNKSVEEQGDIFGKLKRAKKTLEDKPKEIDSF